MKICPFCREKIQRLAVVCRFCNRDLPAPAPARRKSSGGIWAAFAAGTIIVATSAIMAMEFMRERNNWRN